jgi:hypothetical protein
MKRIDGQEVANANAPLKLTITEQDIKNGARKNTNACAVVVSALRQLGTTAGKAHLGCIYLNTNGLVRQYFPRGTDFSRISQVHLNAIALRLNQRPRKTLGFETPADKLQAVLH